MQYDGSSHLFPVAVLGQVVATRSLDSIERIVNESYHFHQLHYFAVICKFFHRSTFFLNNSYNLSLFKTQNVALRCKVRGQEAFNSSRYDVSPPPKLNVALEEMILDFKVN